MTRAGQTRTDLLVFGAGPGGLSAAIAAASKGYGVTVLEALAWPRARPGETLHPGVEALFPQLGVAGTMAGAGFRRHAGVWMQGPADVAAVFHPYGRDEDGPWMGWHAPGALFDDILARRAIDLGVDFRSRTRPRSIRLDPLEIVTTQGEISARGVIDATGSGRWLQRRLGVPLIVASEPRQVHWRDEVVDPSETFEPQLRLAETGWTWRARLTDEVAVVCEMRLNGAFGPVSGAGRSRDVTWRTSRRLAGPGWWAVGDAASMLDPLTGKGVLTAMMTGIAAAASFDEVMTGAISAETAANLFHHQIANRFRADCLRMAQFYAA